MARISPSHLGLAVGTFAEQEMYAQAEGIDKVFLAMAIMAIPTKASKLVEDFKPMLEFMDVWTPDGMIDLDTLHQRAQEAFTKTGPVKFKGFSLSSADVDKLYAIARQFAQ